MELLVDGLSAVSHAAEDAGAAAEGGQSFADTAAQAHEAAPAQSASRHAEEAAPKPSGGSSWWDDAVGAVKSAAGHVDDAVHAAGHAVDRAAQGAIDTATGAVRDVAGNAAANAVHGVAEAALDNAKQTAGFVYGAGAGAAEAVGGMVEGTAGLVRTGAKMVTNSAFRGQVIDGAEALASNVAAHPLATAKAVGSSVVHGGEDWIRGAGKAAQEGNLGEYLGRGAGSAAVNVGSFFIPGAGEAEAANIAGHAGEVANVMGHAGEAANVAGHAGETANLASRAGEVASEAGRVSEAVPGARAVERAEQTGAAASHAETVAQGQLRGSQYELPGWHNETVSYTKRQPEALQRMRKEFDGGIRKDFLKDLGKNHADTLRAAGMDDAQIARVSSGRVPAGYQVHHYLPLDDGGTNASDNLVLIKNDPDHMIVTNHQNAATKGMAAGDTRVLQWPMPDGPSPRVWPDTPHGGARPIVP